MSIQHVQQLEVSLWHWEGGVVRGGGGVQSTPASRYVRGLLDQSAGRKRTIKPDGLRPEDAERIRVRFTRELAR